jgi:hypothetical protein
MKIDSDVLPDMVREHIAVNGIGPGQLLFPFRLFAVRTVAARRVRMSDEEMQALGYTDPLPNGKAVSARHARRIRHREVPAQLRSASRS